MESVPQLYRHRHKWPYWDEEGAEKVAPLVAQASVDWQQAHHDHAMSPTADTQARLRQKMLDLGVAAWWALNQHGEVFQPEHLDLAGRSEGLDDSENWVAAADPLDAWRAAVTRRLSALFSVMATGYLDVDEAATMYRRQLLFVAYQTEQALAHV